MAERTVNAQSLRWVYVCMANVRRSKKVSMAEIEGMRPGTEGDKIKEIMRKRQHSLQCLVNHYNHYKDIGFYFE